MPRRFAPRNDSGEVSSRPMPSLPCTAATQQVSTHPTRPTALHPLTRRRLLHVIARSGAAAPRRGNPRHRRSTKREAVPKANSQPSTNLPKPQPTCQVSLRGCGLPRRFAPRNDMQKYAACTHGNYVVPGQIRYAFRIRQGHCRAAPSALSAHSLPSESVTQQCTETQRTGKAPR